MSSPIKSVLFGLPGIFPPNSAVKVNTAQYTGKISTVGVFEISLSVLETMDQATLNLPAWPGAQAVVQFSVAEGTQSFFWAGVVESVTAEASGSTAGISGLNLRLSGWPSGIGRSSFSKRYQFYQDKNSASISEQIFSASGGTFKTHLKNPPSTRRYEVQYGESDVGFMTRILTEDNLLYRISSDLTGRSFPIEPSALRCDVYEDLLSFPKVENISTLAILNALNKPSIISGAGIYDVKLDLQRPLEEVALAAVDSEQPLVDLRSEVSVSAGDNPVQIPGCPPSSIKNNAHYRIEERANQNYTTHEEGDSKAKAFIDSSASVQIHFNCDLPNLDIGKYFNLDQSGNFSARSVDIAILETTQSLKFNVALGYWEFFGKFTGYSQNVTYVIPLLPPRILPGVLRGVVLDKNDDPQYAAPSNDDRTYTDALGRLKIRILWHNAVRRSETNAQSTVWVRMMTPWAGHSAGFLAIPKVGQEVMIGFINNDPANPVVIGCMYSDVAESGSLPPWNPSSGSWVGIGARTSSDTVENKNNPQHIRLNSDPANQLGVEIASASDLKLNAIKSLVIAAKDTEINSPSGTIKLNATNLLFNGENSLKNRVPGGVNEVTYDSQTTRIGTLTSNYGASNTNSGINLNTYGTSTTWTPWNGFFLLLSTQFILTQWQVMHRQIQTVNLKHERIGLFAEEIQTYLLNVNAWGQEATIANVHNEIELRYASLSNMDSEMVQIG